MAPKGKSRTKKGKEVSRPEAGQPATLQNVTQPEALFSFKTLRTCLEPAEATRFLFRLQRGGPSQRRMLTWEQGLYFDCNWKPEACTYT